MAVDVNTVKVGENKEHPYITLIKEQNFTKIQELFTTEKVQPAITPEESMKQYNVREHEVFDEAKRPKKIVNKDTGERTASGEVQTVATPIEVARIAVPFQKIIVGRRTGFMLSEPVKLEATYSEQDKQEREFVRLIEKILDENKMDYKNKEVARRLMSELEVAEIWYLAPNTDAKAETKFTLKMKIISPDLGDILYPLFDQNGDMVAFARSYKLKEEGKEIEHYDVYTPEFEYRYVNRGSWGPDANISPNPIPNKIGKIPIIYYFQKEPEWYDVQPMVGRYETNLSNHGDMNDYFGSPMLTIQGKIQGFAQKGEQGKILELEQGANAAYLALSSEPMSIKMEQENLERLIYTMSQTPNITFDEMKGLGALSGVALRLLFLDAHMAVYAKEEVFGMGLQRRINFIKAAIGKVINTAFATIADSLTVKPKITPYIPQNETELLDNLGNALNVGIISTQTAVEKSPLTDDPEVERQRIESDEKANLKKQQESLQFQSNLQNEQFNQNETE